MPLPDDELARFHRDTGLEPLDPRFAKLEVMFGLAAVGLGLRFLVAGTQPYTVIAGVLLFALGGYLALAGHRSHLYQSNNRLTAYLAGLVRPPKSGNPP